MSEGKAWSARAWVALLGARPTGEGAPALRAALEATLAAAHAAWPTVLLPDDAFVAYLADRAPAAADPCAALARLHATDLYLACGCVAGDARALACLERSVLPAVSDYVRRLDPSAVFADEVREALRERLLVGDGERAPRIATYTGEGPLGAWLRTAAVRTAQNLRRGRRPAAPLEAARARAPGADPELALLRRRCEAAFRTALERTLAALPAEERTILRLHHLEGLTVQALGAMYRVHASTIARRIARTRERVLAATHAALREHMCLGESELASVMGLLGSELDVSVCRLLASAPARRPR